jgi:hypothetical protein
MKHGLLLLGVGAGLMYFFDPQNGRHRRALARDRYVSTVRTLDESRRVVMRASPQAKSRALAGALGSALAVIGLFRGGLGGLAMGALGSGLAARAATNPELKRLARARGDSASSAPDYEGEPGNLPPEAAMPPNLPPGQEISAPPPGAQRH